MREIEEIHIPFLAWLNELEIPCVYHRPDRKSGIQRGWPDFTIAYGGRVVFIEAKTDEGRLSIVQASVHNFIRASGNTVEVCRSVEECKEAVRKHVLHDGLTESFYPQVNAAPVLADAAPTKGARNPIGGDARESISPKTADVREADSRGGVQFYIIDWDGKPYVVAPDQGDAFMFIRQASLFDRLHLPRLPA